MNLTENFIIDIINNYHCNFLYKKNVVGMALGNKIINNIDTKEICLQIYVKNKVPSNKLLPHEIIPKNFKGIKTDVIESGINEFSASKNKNAKDIALLKQYKRPLQGGFEISPLTDPVITGTLGAIVFDNDNDTPYILSTSHLLSNYNSLLIGSPIFQPAKNSQSNPFNVIAYLYKKTFLYYSSINNFSDFLKNSTAEFNYADCAIGKITSNTPYTKEIYKIGTIKGIKEANIGLKIKKVGKSTGYTTSNIKSINGLHYVSFGNYLFPFQNCIACDKMSEEGDSGSLILDSSNRAIGLLIGSSSVYDIITPISSILNYLNIHF